MSVNLPRPYRVIAMVVAVTTAFVALAWTGDNHLAPASIHRWDTTPAPHQPAKKAPKAKKRAAEGRVARELDLRMDVEDKEGMPNIADLNSLKDFDISIDPNTLKGLNARVEGEVLKNMDAWNNLDALKDLDFREMVNIDALVELKDIFIDEQDLRTLKDLNIDDEIWNELKDLKDHMDDLREQLEEDRANGINGYRLQREVDAIAEALRAEMPRVRREVQKALQEFKESQRGRSWQ